MRVARLMVLLLSFLLLVTACGLLPADDEPADTKDPVTQASLNPAPACSSFDLGPVFDAYGGPDPEWVVSDRSIGSTKGCHWSPVQDNVGFTARIVMGEHPDLSAQAVLAYAQAEWADATGGEPFPEDQFRPGEHGWSYGMTSTVPIIQILKSHWLTQLTADGALRCHFWGFDDVTVAWAACDAIRAAVTPAA